MTQLPNLTLSILGGHQFHHVHQGLYLRSRHTASSAQFVADEALKPAKPAASETLVWTVGSCV